MTYEQFKEHVINGFESDIALGNVLGYDFYQVLDEWLGSTGKNVIVCIRGSGRGTDLTTFTSRSQFDQVVSDLSVNSKDLVVARENGPEAFLAWAKESFPEFFE